MDYISKELSQHRKIYYQDEIYEELINNVVDALLRDQEDDNLELIKEKLTPDKDGKKRNIEVYKYYYQDQEYYIKHFYQRRVSKRIFRMFRGPQGLNNFKKAVNFEVNNIPCATPVACITYKDNLFDTDSIFISKGLAGLNILEILMNKDSEDISVVSRINVARQIGRISARLVNNNFLHKDPNPKNFICTGGSNPRVYVIDFESIYQLSYLPSGQVAHFIARTGAKFYVWFVLNDIGPPTPGEKKAFIKAFFKNIERDLDFNKFIKKVNRLTVKKILSREGESILNDDPEMLKLI